MTSRVDFRKMLKILLLGKIKYAAPIILLLVTTNTNGQKRSPNRNYNEAKGV